MVIYRNVNYILEGVTLCIKCISYIQNSVPKVMSYKSLQLSSNIYLRPTYSTQEAQQQQQHHTIDDVLVNTPLQLTALVPRRTVVQHRLRLMTCQNLREVIFILQSQIIVSQNCSWTVRILEQGRTLLSCTQDKEIQLEVWYLLFLSATS